MRWTGTYLGVPVSGFVMIIVNGTIYDESKVRLHLYLDVPVKAFGQTFRWCLVEAKNGTH